MVKSRRKISLSMHIKKILGKWMSCIILIVLIISSDFMKVEAFEENAKEGNNVVEVFIDDDAYYENTNINARGITKPTKKYSTNQWEEISGSITNGTLYSEGYYTNIYKITLIIVNDANTDMTVILANPSDVGNFKVCDEQIIEANSSKTIYYNNLNQKRTYFFAFKNSDNFSGKSLGFESSEE